MNYRHTILQKLATFCASYYKDFAAEGKIAIFWENQIHNVICQVFH